MKKVKTLNDKEQEAVAYFFAFFWAVVVLAPRDHQPIRAVMKRLGLVKQRGPLALTPAGERVLVFARDDSRPRYLYHPVEIREVKRGKK